MTQWVSLCQRNALWDQILSRNGIKSKFSSRQCKRQVDVKVEVYITKRPKRGTE